MPGVICHICERQECVEPWTICGECDKKRLECRRSEDAIRALNRKDNEKLTGKTTPGMRNMTASVHERRGRKIIRHVRQDLSLWEDSDESE